MHKCVRCEYMEVKRAGRVCSVCSSVGARIKQHENNVIEYLTSHEDLSLFTYHNVTLPCSRSMKRPDIVYVLSDRVVILEVDEQQHRYASAALCEREREFQILDDLRAWDLYAVLVRFNPTQKNTNPWKSFEELGRALRLAFVTEDVRWASDGLHRVYLGYSSTRIRELEAVYSGAQKTALRDASFGGADDPVGDVAVVGAARAEGLISPELSMREWCSKFAKAVQTHGTTALFETEPETVLRRALGMLKERQSASEQVEVATQTEAASTRSVSDIERFRLVPNKTARKRLRENSCK